MAQTVAGFAQSMKDARIAIGEQEIASLRAIVNDSAPLLRFTGRQFWIPFKAPERVAWDDAVAWLEARKAADAEWPWPRRADHPTYHVEDYDA